MGILGWRERFNFTGGLVPVAIAVLIAPSPTRGRTQVASNSNSATFSNTTLTGTPVRISLAMARFGQAMERFAEYHFGSLDAVLLDVLVPQQRMLVISDAVEALLLQLVALDRNQLLALIWRINWHTSAQPQY